MSTSTSNRTIRSQDWNVGALSQIIDRFSDSPIAVVGDVGVDRYTEGEVERISPEAPVPIVRVTGERLKLGLAANVADNLRSLGGAPALFGTIGKDRIGEDLIALAQEAGIGVDGLVEDSRRTVLKERIVSERQQLLRVDYESADQTDNHSEQKILDQLKQMSGVQAIVLEDYAKGTLTSNLCEQVIQHGVRSKIPVLVDPNATSGLMDYRGATLLTPNKKEAEQLANRKIRSNEDLHWVADHILHRAQLSNIVITLGKDGVFLKGADVEPTLIPTSVREVYDVSGAGDTVIAVLALVLGSGGSLSDAAVLANVAAGVEVSKRGTATVEPSEIRSAMEYFNSQK